MKQTMTVRDLRRSQKMTQRDLADALGVSPGAVANWEVGLRTPGLATAKNLATFFGVMVEDIRFDQTESTVSSHATRSA